jgi:hypothetical protein
VRRSLRPDTLGVIGLALAIALWAFGLRLSGYQLHPSSTGRTAAAKMCVEPRNSSLAAAARLKANVHLIGGALALCASPQDLPRIESGFVCLPPEPPQRPASFSPLLPARSPPQRFSLA